MTVTRSSLEKKIQADIEADLGAESDLLLLRNSVGKALHISESDGKDWHVPYGLGVGSPDLVGILKKRFRSNDILEAPVTVGVWLCLEVKVPGEEATLEQTKVHHIWRRFGALVFTVHSVVEARAALNEARRLA